MHLTFTEETYSRLYDQLTDMSEEERLELDKVCSALQPFSQYISPNRILALAVLELMNEYHQLIELRE